MTLSIEEQIADVRQAIQLIEDSMMSNAVCYEANHAQLSKLLLVQAKMADLINKGLVKRSERFRAQHIAEEMCMQTSVH